MNCSFRSLGVYEYELFFQKSGVYGYELSCIRVERMNMNGLAEDCVFA